MKNIRNFDKWLKDYLVKDNNLPQHEIDEYELESKKNSVPFHEIIIRNGVVDSNYILQKFKPYSHYDVINLEEQTIQNDALSFIPKIIMNKYNVIPIDIDKDNNQISIAMSEPNNLTIIDAIRQETKMQMKIYFSLHSQIKHVIESYEKNANINNIIDEMRNSVKIENDDENEISDIENSNSDESAIIRLVNSILSDAVSAGATDIHIEPLEKFIRVRFRVDGLLIERINNLQKQMLNQIISRIKILSNLDISEIRRPQDGRFNIKTNNLRVDIRVSTMNSQFGEKVVMRLSIKNTTLSSLDNMGFTPKESERLKQISKRPFGLILVVGPTGSGKTTTLYGILNYLNSSTKNIVTIEDPIERQIPGIIHTSINTKADITFGSGLKTILRQDPDIIMVGEIRDFVTADTTVSSAMTGHLALSTLHTNDAAESIPRLSEMGVEAFKVSSSLVAVIAQRLVRINCEHCSVEYDPTDEELSAIQSIFPNEPIPTDLKLRKGLGCKKCSKTGFKGRRGVFELLVISPEIKKLILNKNSVLEIQQQAIKEGMETMSQRGIELVLNGLSTLDEIKRVIFVD